MAEVINTSTSQIINEEDSFSPFGSPRLAPALMQSIVKEEGSALVDNPKDPGGATKFGIAYNYNKKDLKKYGINSPSEMGKLTEDQANEIYTTKYYEPSKAEQLPFEAKEAYMNSYINSPDKGVKALQETVGTSADGKFGKNTEAQIQQYLKTNSPEDLALGIRRNYIKQLINSKGKNNNWSSFGNGWVNRYLGLKNSPFGETGNRINLNDLKTEDDVFNTIELVTGIKLN
jgi:lysozyme family protein